MVAVSLKNLGGANEKQRDALSRFGELTGVAFQLIDDALDYLSSSERFGKPTLADLKEGKVTMPVILLREVCSGAEQARISSMLDHGAIDDADMDWIAGLVEKHNTALQTIDLATSYTLEAVQCLHVFPESSERADLESLAMKLVRRFN